jgi:hypothetical protein
MVGGKCGIKEGRKMLGFFIRLILGGLIRLALSVFILYSLLVYAPGGVNWSYQIFHMPLVDPIYRGFTNWPEYWELHKPWPLSYLAWLFDPEDTLAPPVYDLQGLPQQRPMGINISLGSLQIKGSGILTGDFGQSWNIDLDRPVSDMLGPGISEMFAFLLSLITALMAIVAAQRWRRPQPYRVSSLPTVSSLVDWWYLHSGRPIDAAVFRGQLA